MIVSCPACSTGFAVDDSLIGPSGRKVRCAKCSHRWHQMPTGPDEAAPVAAPTPESSSSSEQLSAIAAAIAERLAVAPEAGSAPPVPGLTAETPMQDIPSAVIRPRPSRFEDQPEAKAKPRRRRGLLVAGILLGVVIAVPGAGYIWRNKIARSAPWAQDMYSLLGIRTDDPMSDLEIANLKTVSRMINDKPAAEITGVIFNKAQYAVNIPNLAATAFDDHNAKLPNPYKFHLPQQILEPGETASFRVIYEGLPAGTKGINVDFDNQAAD